MKGVKVFMGRININWIPKLDPCALVYDDEAFIYTDNGLNNSLPPKEMAFSTKSFNDFIHNKYIDTKEAKEFINRIPIHIKTTTVYTMLKSNLWKNNIYNLESKFPSNKYEISIKIDTDRSSDAQLLAYNNANITKLITSNNIRAFGDSPTINIPVILTLGAPTYIK